jgi:hypothetical protein
MVGIHQLKGTVTNRQVAKSAKTTKIRRRTPISFAFFGFFAVRFWKG